MEIKSLVYSVLSNPKLYDLSCYCIIEHMSKLVFFGGGGAYFGSTKKYSHAHCTKGFFFDVFNLKNSPYLEEK
jgi:hypothetical protein